MQALTPYRNREDAGRALGTVLVNSLSDPNVLVLALPRGGVVVGYEVADALRAELDVFLVRKIGMPGDEEFAIGAIASGGTCVLNEDAIRRFHIPREAVDQVIAKEEAELQRRENLYRESRAIYPIENRTVVLVDDGLATGSTMIAACRALRTKHPGRIVAAVPVGPRQTCEQLRRFADEVICARTPDHFVAIGAWYEDFSQTTDDEVRQLLEQASRRTSKQ